MTLRFVIEVFGYAVGLPLEVLLVMALLRGAYVRFPFVFVYAVASLLASAIEFPLYILGWADRHSRVLYVRTFWINEQVLLGLVYCVVISLVYEGTSPTRSRRIVRSAVVASALLFAAITFAVHFNTHIKVGEWMTPWTRELNFCAAVLDLGLWALLIGVRQKDHRLLMLSGALGILFTGEAIGESVRQIAQSAHSGPISLFGSVLILLADQIFLYIWWQAFRRESVSRTKSPAK
jgi:hypothetical protein